jgi:hypothetical protein
MELGTVPPQEENAQGRRPTGTASRAIIAGMALVIVLLAGALGYVVGRSRGMGAPASTPPPPSVAVPTGGANLDDALAAPVGDDKSSSEKQRIEDDFANTQSSDDASPHEEEDFSGAQEGEASDGFRAMTPYEANASKSNRDADLASGYRMGEIGPLDKGGPGLRNFRWCVVAKRQEDGVVRNWVKWSVDCYTPRGIKAYALRVEVNPGRPDYDFAVKQLRVFKEEVWGYDNGEFRPVPRAENPDSAMITVAAYK